MTDVCSHGRPDHQDLIGQLLDALGMGTHARPMTPQAVFSECLTRVAELRRRNDVLTRALALLRSELGVDP